MGNGRSRLARWLVVVLAALATAVALAVPTAGAHQSKHGTHPHQRAQHGKAHQQGKPLTVMTRNLYLGASLNRALAAAAAPPDRQLEVLIGAATTIRAIVDQTSFPLRAQ